MLHRKPLAILAGAALVALAACGGSDSSSSGPKTDRSFTSAPEVAKDASRQGPAPDIEGATKGGTITVLLPGDPGPDTLDPAAGWSVTGNSIQQALTNRSLTQYSKDAKTGEMVLVPDLATDLGTPNEDYTEWTFTIRADATWEDGKPVTPEEIAWGIQRTMDSDTFPAGPGTEYSQTYFSGAGEYQGPYTEPGQKWDGVTVDGNDITIKMAKPFPDMDYWGAFMAMGPAPLGKASDSPDYGAHPLSTGPYKVESFRPEETLTLVKNEQWDPATDPARHQYADKWVFKFVEDQAKVDQIMLSDNTESQTTMSTKVGSNNYDRMSTELGDRLVQQSAQCTSFLAPDATAISDLNVRKAIAYAYPYQDFWLATGQVPGVTRVPANTIMPPGMAGRRDYFVDGEQFTYDPAKARELLKTAGYEPGEFKLTMIYFESDPLAVAGQRIFAKGYEDAGFTVKGIPVQEDPYNTWTNPDDKLNKSLNLRATAWCSDWPSGLTMIPPLVKTGAAYNTAHFSEPSIDKQIDAIPSMPIDDQADAWGALDEKVEKEYFPIIPTAFRNDLYAFGARIGNPSGDGAIGAPNYKDLYVAG
ncbi:MAG TPA: ABC transporter substrate-binding protein [Nocardioides sp.]|jgi:peptide/nickel transport system substrate-binding protein|nr:ABC transporter substrate-binding protein [Nocardioides sp.]